MTAEEKQEILAEVLSAIRTNSALITDLTEVETIPEGSYIELSGGKRIEADTMRIVIQEAIYGALETAINAKFDKANVVAASGSSSTLVMSQGYVTLLINGIGVKLANVNVVLGTKDADKNVIRFTNADGTTSSVTLNKASSSTAGLMSAADKNALEQLKEDVPDLHDAMVTDASLETGSDSATIVIATNGEGGGHEVVIPKAGTVPTGETDPVAGVMSAQQAQDLEDVILEVFPLIASFTASNAGVYEKGQTVTPAATLGVTRRGVNVLSEATITTSMTVEGNQLSYEAVTENTTLNVSVSHKGSTVQLPALRYTFYNYVYGDVLSALPGDMVEAIAGASTLAELSGRTTYEGRLAANKYFLFAVPGNVNLVCRHAETGAAITGCTTGTVLIPRQCDANTTDSYSYIIVPKSDIAWNFKITNT